MATAPRGGFFVVGTAAAMIGAALLGCGSARSDSSESDVDDTSGDEDFDGPPIEAGPSSYLSVTPNASVLAAVDSPDRSESDRILDEGRHPSEIFTFFEIAPGQRVFELFAGGGYTSELLARIVGSEGQVYAQNNTWVLDRFARAPLEQRLPNHPNIVALEHDFDSPIPADVRDLDAVLFILAYHDTVWLEADRAAMNLNIFESLRSGGVYGIVDHSARPGDGISVSQSLHRIEESVLIEEVEAAGFHLESRLEILRNPDDARDWAANPSQAGDRRGSSDRFVLLFRKP